MFCYWILVSFMCVCFFVLVCAVIHFVGFGRATNKKAELSGFKIYSHSSQSAKSQKQTPDNFLIICSRNKNHNLCTTHWLIRPFKGDWRVMCVWLLLMLAGYFKTNHVMKGILWAPFVSNNNLWGVTGTAALNGPHTHKDKPTATAKSSWKVLCLYMHVLDVTAVSS